METIDNIIDELRESAELFIKDGVDQGLENPCEVFNEYADRIEKAYKFMVEGLNGGIVERDQYIAELTDNNKRIIADRNELVELNRKCCDENERLKQALQPVLDIVMDSATSDLSMELAINEAKRIYKESTKGTKQ